MAAREQTQTLKGRAPPVPGGARPAPSAGAAVPPRGVFGASPSHPPRSDAPETQNHLPFPQPPPHPPLTQRSPPLPHRSQEYDPSAALDPKAEARNPLRSRAELADAPAALPDLAPVALEAHELKSVRALKARCGETGRGGELRERESPSSLRCVLCVCAVGCLFLY